MFPLLFVIALVLLVVVFVIVGTRRGAYPPRGASPSARKVVQDGDAGFPLELVLAECHHHKQSHHDGQSAHTHGASDRGHNAASVTHHDGGSFHDSSGHSGFDGGGFGGGHH